MGVIALVIALALFMYLAKTREVAQHRDEALSLPVVRAVECVTRPIARQWTGYGTARAMEASDVAAEVAGAVVERPERLEAGVAVEKGDLLLRLDPSDYQDRVQSAQTRIASLEAQLSGLEVQEARLNEQADLLAAEKEIAERDLQRAKDALEKGAGNESQVDAKLQALKAVNRNRAAVLSQLEVIPSKRAETNASLESARADLRMAQQNLARTEIRAPFAGVLQRMDLQVGEWARVGDAVARVVDLSRIEVPLRLPQEAGSALKAGDEATLTVEGPATQTWAGAVSRLAPESDASIRSMTVFVEVRQQPDGSAGTLLRPGQFVMGRVVSRDVVERMVVPRHSVDVDTVLTVVSLGPNDPTPPTGASRPMIVQQADVNVVHYLEGRFDRVSPTETQWAVLIDRGISSSRALHAGDLVLVSNLESLRPGDLVDVRVEGDGVAASARGDGPTGDQP
ncbi:MAG: HlyD family efflux transporter periplasmic adaptor subunit [Phycisphaeraceae bacterium]|nr:MAG: HlyD family efflux transporter periplasmic adaptor subunit [Phycisphaeraceae bacterium]